MKNLSTL